MQYIQNMDEVGSYRIAQHPPVLTHRKAVSLIGQVVVYLPSVQQLVRVV